MPPTPQNRLLCCPGAVGRTQGNPRGMRGSDDLPISSNHKRALVGFRLLGLGVYNVCESQHTVHIYIYIYTYTYTHRNRVWGLIRA